MKLTRIYNMESVVFTVLEGTPHARISDTYLIKKVIENLIKKNASLEKRMKEMEINFTILCIALIVSLSTVFIMFYV